MGNIKTMNCQCVMEAPPKIYGMIDANMCRSSRVTWMLPLFCYDPRRYRLPGNGIAFKVILCLCCIVFSSMSQGVGDGTEQIKRFSCPEGSIGEDVTLKTITVYLGGVGCPDTVIMEDIKIRVKRQDCLVTPYGCGDGERTGWFLITDIDTLQTSCGLNVFWWKKGTAYYPAVIDSASLRRLGRAIWSFEQSPASCLRKFD